jgi:hypothetical protein
MREREKHEDDLADQTISEFDFRTLSDGSSAAVRYANNSNYRNDSLIRKESESRDLVRNKRDRQSDKNIQCV